ncbi:hypothetical protein [Xanthovirga aplysinae]|uniref:hypothetical protein n=1 Tax=Xanthovirga aplysinae TaxID=2529853 RepID=UPI0012BCC0A0|nr:hypothetical protein [Xanthovirga aplysinae]MTI30430.1 hypothetical protein [Xanthovirga aplysinae]
MIPACYPSSFPYGRYRLQEYPSGAKIDKSVSNGKIVDDYGDEIYISVNSSGRYKVEARVRRSAGCDKVSSGYFESNDCSFL